MLEGTSLLTAALQESARHDPLVPATTATRDGSSWRLDGVKVAVPHAPLVDRILVSAQTDGRHGAVPPRSRRATVSTIEPSRSTNREVQGNVVLDGAVVDDDDVLARSARRCPYLHRHAIAGMCATAVGVLDEAVKITAGYISRAPAVRQADRDVPGRDAEGRRRVHRHRGRPRDDVVGDLASRDGTLVRRGARDREVLGRRTADRTPSTTASTCTAAWASTPTTRSTATSSGRRSSSSRSAARRRSCSRSAQRSRPRGEQRLMHLDLTDEQQALQLELREYFAKLVTPEKRVETDEEEEMGDVLAGHGPADGDGRLQVGDY